MFRFAEIIFVPLVWPAVVMPFAPMLKLKLFEPPESFQPPVVELKLNPATLRLVASDGRFAVGGFPKIAVLEVRSLIGAA